MDREKTTPRRDEKHLSFWIECTLYYWFEVAFCRTLSGAVYRFNGTNPCNQLEADFREVDLHTNGDVYSCEARNGTTTDMFGLFLDGMPRRYVVVTVIGSHMNCNPVDGLHVTISSTSHQSYICKSMPSHSSDRCHYRCSCIDHFCSHITFGILGVDNGDICEIKIDWRELRIPGNVLIYILYIYIYIYDN